MVEVVVEPFKLHFTSMSYIYKVFEDLQLLWMGIWLYPPPPPTQGSRLGIKPIIAYIALT